MRKTKYIRFKKSPLVKERLALINRAIKQTLNESFNSVIPTEHKEIHNEWPMTIYRFTTNSGNSYDLEFMLGYESSDIFKKIVTVVDVAFVPSEINMDDRDNHELYSKETNRKEQYELMGRITYLLKEFIRNNEEYNVYVFGKNTEETKQSMYNKMYENHFYGEFVRVEGKSSQYDEGAFFFIKNDFYYNMIN